MLASTDAAAEVPRQLGRYEVLGELARGGMASVHLGRVSGAGGFERIVAIKCCHAHLSGDPEFISMFFDEARIAASIHHPNVVATVDVGNEGSVLYQVMEYVEGERLFDLIKSTAKSGGLLPLPIAARIMVDALHGLHAAHELVDSSGVLLDVVHRDISPQNVMVGTDGITRIMDFGIARAAARSTVTEKGVLKGKFSYMAPEQLLGQGVDRRCDVFAAGVVLWESLVGRRLFAGDSQGETLHRVLHIPIEPPSKLRPEAAPLDEVVQRALCRTVEDRYPTALAFAEAIEATGIEIARPAAVAARVRAMGSSTTAERRRSFLQRRADGAPPAIPTPVSNAGAAAAGPIAPIAVEAESTQRHDAPRSRAVLTATVCAIVALAIVIMAVAWSALSSETPSIASETSTPSAPATDPAPAASPATAAPAIVSPATVATAPDPAPTLAAEQGATGIEAPAQPADPSASPDRARAPSSPARARDGRPRAPRTTRPTAPATRPATTGPEYIPRSL